MKKGAPRHGGHAGKNSREPVYFVHSSSWVRRTLPLLLEQLGYRARPFDGTPDQLKSLAGSPEGPAVILFDLDSETEQAYRSLEGFIRDVRPIPVVVVSASSDPATIVQTVRLGAEGYLVRPFGVAKLAHSLSGALARSHHQEPPGPGPVAEDRFPRLICASAKMNALEKIVRLVADSDATVLIAGESGSGKEVVARHLHQRSTRAEGPFGKVNCAALPDELLESELFGYEKGAFTGATSHKAGRFECANRGTIFLDEIAEMSVRLQAKLLQVLQDKRFHRLGGTGEIEVDVRVIAATNKNLEREVEEGRFREDLYFRLKVVDLYVPPLRERPEDIPLFIDYFLQRFSEQYRRQVPELSERLLNLFLSHRWAGNVRELENMIKRIVILGDERGVMQEILRQSSHGAGQESGTISPKAGPAAEAGVNLKKAGRRAARAAERSLILRTLEKTHWNRVRTSRILGVSYKTLLTKMKEAGLR